MSRIDISNKGAFSLSYYWSAQERLQQKIEKQEMLQAAKEAKKEKGIVKENIL